jgi:hypothetical protein
MTDPYTALAVAILAQAVNDYKKGDKTAGYWLIETGAEWLPALGYDLHPDRLLAWLDSGCPRKRGRPIIRFDGA